MTARSITAMLFTAVLLAACGPKEDPQAAAKAAAAQQAQAAKAARDLEFNRQRQIAAEKKERAAQIKQLIEQNRLPKLETDDYFNFIHRQKVRRIAVDEALRARIMNGDVVLVPRGYHPCGTAHGYELYYLNVMAGPKRIWRFNTEACHRWLLAG